MHIARDGEPLVELARELGAEARFHALGEMARERVLAAYREADLFLSPAAIESLGIVTFEAMAAGLPCLVSDGPGNRDAVEHGRAGLIVPVGDTDAMAATLVDLMRDRDGRGGLGVASREIVARFAWPVVAGEYADAFRRLVEHTTSGADEPR